MICWVGTSLAVLGVSNLALEMMWAMAVRTLSADTIIEPVAVGCCLWCATGNNLLQYPVYVVDRILEEEACLYSVCPTACGTFDI